MYVLNLPNTIYTLISMLVSIMLILLLSVVSKSCILILKLKICDIFNLVERLFYSTLSEFDDKMY